MEQDNKAFSRFVRMDEMGLTEEMAGWQHLARFIPVLDEWDGQLCTAMEIMRGGKSVKQTEDAIWRAMEMARKKRPREWETAPWNSGTKRMLYWFRQHVDSIDLMDIEAVTRAIGGRRFDYDEEDEDGDD